MFPLPKLPSFPLFLQQSPSSAVCPSASCRCNYNTITSLSLSLIKFGLSLHVHPRSSFPSSLRHGRVNPRAAKERNCLIRAHRLPRPFNFSFQFSGEPNNVVWGPQPSVLR
ncbi:hypothetical protein PS2_003121 [Malus domestica]